MGNETFRALYICSDVNNDTDYCWQSPLIPSHTWVHIHIQQIQDGDKHVYQVLIDGKVQHEKINKSPRVFYNVTLYVSNPWYPAQQGLMEDLEYSWGLYFFLDIIRGNNVNTVSGAIGIIMFYTCIAFTIFK